MNILVLNNNSDLYGGSKIMSIVVNILADAKHTPIVVVSETGPLIDELQAMGIEVRIIRLGILRRKYMNPKGLLNRWNVSRKAWKALNDLIDEKQIDVIYSNTTGVFIGAFLARKRKIRHIWHVHEIIQKPKIFTAVIGFLLKKYADKIIVVSNAVKKHWQNYVDEKQIVKIYNGINTKPFQTASPTLRNELKLQDTDVLVTMIGRVNHWKGQHYFLDIAEKLTDKNLYFLLVGDAFPGNEHLVENLKQRIADQKYQNVFYLGYRTDTANILASSDIFVSPSIEPDPFPTVILEAMAAGKPIIATAHGGALEMVVNGQTGYHIPFDDADKASKIIQQLVRDRNERDILGQNASERIHQYYSLKSFKEAILSIFEEYQTN